MVDVDKQYYQVVYDFKEVMEKNEVDGHAFDLQYEITNISEQDNSYIFELEDNYGQISYYIFNQKDKTVQETDSPNFI